MSEENKEKEVQMLPKKAKASNKTTAVMLSMVIILVAVVAVLAVVFLKDKIGGDDEQGADTQTAQNGDTQTPQPTEAPKDYHVQVATLGEYKNLKVTWYETEATDDEVNQTVKEQIEAAYDLIEVTDRPVGVGDIVNIDYEGYMDGDQFQGGTAKGTDLEIGSNQFIEGFESAIVGHKLGEEKFPIYVKFPDNYGSADLAGRPATFYITINKITAKVVPDICDATVKEHFDYDTLEEYEAYIREELTKDKTSQVEELQFDEAMAQIIGASTFTGEIDEEIKDQVDGYLEYYDYMFQMYYGVDIQTYCMYMGMTLDDMRAQLTEEVGMSVKGAYVLQKIAEVEGYTVSEEEYENKFHELILDYYGYTSREEAVAALTEEEVDRIVNASVTSLKAKDLILETMIPTVRDNTISVEDLFGPQE